ncbi:MAG TPA: hypothetical protein VFU07_05295 [Candidatus Lumbricidophila sp.]|nr:hypothetical protein [Candidatus Lumbricidophila sp.]
MVLNRTLGIPVFETVGAPDPDGLYETDEIYAGRPSMSQKRQENARKFKESPKGQRQEFERERAAQQQATQAAARAGDPIAQLRLSTQNAGMALMNGLRRSGIARPGVTNEQQKLKLSAWQRAYASSMVFSCMEPLRRGMKSETVLETVGISAMMWLCSPVFRAQVGNQLSSVHEAITTKISRFGEKKALAQEAISIERGKSREDVPRKRWARRLDRIERMDRHGLPPLTAESAALMEIGIAESAYQEMRIGGVDVDEVARLHRTALTELYTMAERDGVEPAEISQKMRLIVGARLKHEPRLGLVFNDLAHGRFVQNEQGQIIDGATHAQVDRGSFILREPMDSAQHAEAMKGVFEAGLSKAFNHSPDALLAQMYVYAVGLETSRFPEVVDEATDPVVRRWLGQSRSMFLTMADDKLTADEARSVYSMTFVNVINDMAAKSPAFAELWHGPDGAAWREHLSDRLRAFDDLGEQTKAGHSRKRQQAAEEEGVHYTAHTVWEHPSPPYEDVLDAEIIYEPIDDESKVVDDDVVDAEIVDWFEAGRGTADVPSPGKFQAPKYDGHWPEKLLLEQMATFIGQDITTAAHIDRGTDLAGNSWVARRSFGSPLAAFRAFEDESSMSRLDPSAFERSKEMLTMRQEMERLGMPARRQDMMFAAAYVRGLEKSVLADPAFERVVKQAEATASSPAWQEIEFARALAQTHTGSVGRSYREFVAEHGLDPDILYSADESEPAHIANVRAAQTAFENSMPQSIRDGSIGAALKENAEERDRRKHRTSFIRGRINREYNAEGNNVQILDPETDAQFGLID